MKNSPLQALWGNPLLRPILASLHAREVLLFIVLLGVLPSVEDLSLFWVDRVSR
jgi:hypothetical protein